MRCNTEAAGQKYRRTKERGCTFGAQLHMQAMGIMHRTLQAREQGEKEEREIQSLGVSRIEKRGEEKREKREERREKVHPW
jgi:hypothetical protein